MASTLERPCPCPCPGSAQIPIDLIISKGLVLTRGDLKVTDAHGNLLYRVDSGSTDQDASSKNKNRRILLDATKNPIISIIPCNSNVSLSLSLSLWNRRFLSWWSGRRDGPLVCVVDHGWMTQNTCWSASPFIYAVTIGLVWGPSHVVKGPKLLLIWEDTVDVRRQKCHPSISISIHYALVGPFVYLVSPGGGLDLTRILIF